MMKLILKSKKLVTANLNVILSLLLLTLILIELRRYAYSPKFNFFSFKNQLFFKSSNLKSFHIFNTELEQMKTAVFNLYASLDRAYLNCPQIPHGLNGTLDLFQMLDKVNLSILVNFFDPHKLKHRSKYRDYFYLRENELDKFKKSLPKNELLLWNTNNITLLNMSNDLLGSEGERVKLGGFWKPRNCISNFKIAVVIPYKDRLPHLKVLVYYLHNFLQRQMLDYRIYVVEPKGARKASFNKGRVYNAAFSEAVKLEPDIDCVIFHDVDLLPEDDRILYSCPESPRHLSVLIDKFEYVLPYTHLVGGVFAIKTEHYRLINGYSNLYWGWGGEDDDLSVRIAAKKLSIFRPPVKFARYKMMRHKLQNLNPNRIFNLRRANKRLNSDGLNTNKYGVMERIHLTGFTYLKVDIGKEKN